MKLTYVPPAEYGCTASKFPSASFAKGAPPTRRSLASPTLLEYAVSWIGSIDSDRPARRDIQIGHPNLGVLAREVSCDVDMALAAVDKSLSGTESTPRARRIVGRIEGQLTILDEGDRRTRVAVPTGMAAGADNDLLHHGIGRLGDMYDLG